MLFGGWLTKPVYTPVDRYQSRKSANAPSTDGAARLVPQHSVA